VKITIAGVGAIGGFIGARLASLPDVKLSAFARGATAAALREFGWRLQLPEADRESLLQYPCALATDNAAQIGVQDVVVIAVKATALPTLAERLAPLIGPDTLILPAMNGVPWWFLHPTSLTSVDPDGSIGKHLPAYQSLGCVVHASVSTPQPGVAKVKMGNGLIIGDPWQLPNRPTKQMSQLIDLLARAGFNATISQQIRYDIWYKLWGNMTVNPITAMTGSTADKVFDDPLVRDLCSRCMLEAKAVGLAIGCDIAQTPEDRHVITRKLGAFKTSMLQDVEASRAVELDALIGVVREIGVLKGVPTPYTDMLFGLARLFATNRGLYPYRT
jgi:2-dehydropantoate 2-reductase